MVHACIIIYLNLYTHAYNVYNYIYWVVEAIVDDEYIFLLDIIDMITYVYKTRF